MMCVAPISARCTTRYENSKVEWCEAFLHGLLLTDERRAAHMFPRLDKALTSQGGTAGLALPAHVRPVRRSRAFGNQLMPGSLCRSGGGKQYRRETLQNKFFDIKVFFTRHNLAGKA